MTMSVWPHDTFLTPRPPLNQKDLGLISCFVASPFEPRSRWDDLFQMISSVARQVATGHGSEIRCYRADNIASSGIIHPEIWDALRTSDIVICDVTGQNGNVMLELGIASAWRRKEHVIILREKGDERPHLFDINPARHLEYEVSFSGLQKLASQLASVMSDVLGTFPSNDPLPASIQLPFQASLSEGQDAPQLYTESMTHRRLLTDCLEFGSPLIYRYSWMSLGGLSLKNVRVQAEMRVTLRAKHLDPFFGVMVRGQSYFANLGHLVFVRKDGGVFLNVREDDSGKAHDERLGQIKDFDIQSFAKFDVTIDQKTLTSRINQNRFVVNLKDLPHVFSAGRVLFIAGYCRLGIRNVHVQEITGSKRPPNNAMQPTRGATKSRRVPSARKKRSPRRG